MSSKYQARFWFIVIPCFLVISCEGQLHMLKFINTGTSPSPDAPAQFTSVMSNNATRNIKNRLSNANRICLAGMWALYNTTDFGEGAEDSTTVISVRGTDINTCTQPGQIPVLKNVQSVQYLGNARYDLDGLLIFSQAYLLGGLWNVTVDAEGRASQLPPGVTGFPLGSLAITGKKAWVLCADRDTPCSSGVCVNMKNYANLFLQRNALRDSTLTSGSWPKVVRKVEIISPDDCSNYPTPVAPSNAKRIVRRDVSEKIEFSVYTPSK